MHQSDDSFERMMDAAVLAASAETCSDVKADEGVFCETDALKNAGEEFPAVPPELIQRFNVETMKLPLVIRGRARYEAISAFWHLDEFEQRLAKVVDKYMKLCSRAKLGGKFA